MYQSILFDRMVNVLDKDGTLPLRECPMMLRDRGKPKVEDVKVLDTYKTNNDIDSVSDASAVRLDFYDYTNDKTETDSDNSNNDSDT